MWKQCAFVLMALLLMQCNGKVDRPHHPERNVKVFLVDVCRELALSKTSSKDGGYPSDLPLLGIKHGAGEVQIGNEKFHYDYNPKSTNTVLIIKSKSNPRLQYTIDSKLSISK